LYPVIAGLVSHVPGLDLSQALLIVANVSALLSIPVLVQLVREDFGNEVALITVGLLSFFPSSFFLSAGYSESLGLLLILCCFLSLKRERHAAAAAFAGLALATRQVSIVLLPLICWDLWRKYRTDRSKFMLRMLFCALLATSGLWVYMGYLWFTFNHPLAFATNREAWFGGHPAWTVLLDAILLKPFRQLRLGVEPVRLDGWFLVLFFLLILRLSRKLSPALVLFGLGALLFPYLTFAGGKDSLQCLGTSSWHFRHSYPQLTCAKEGWWPPLALWASLRPCFLCTPLCFQRGIWSDRQLSGRGHRR
jgi:Gpi18-like mannosyltransferase